MKRKATCKYCGKEMNRKDMTLVFGDKLCLDCCKSTVITEIHTSDNIIILWKDDYKKIRTIESFETLKELVMELENNFPVVGGHVDKLEVRTDGRDLGLIAYHNGLHFVLGYVLGGQSKLDMLTKKWSLEELVPETEMAKEGEKMKITPMFIPGGFCVAYKIEMKETGSVIYRPLNGFEATGMNK